MDSLYIVIPAYNEESNILEVIREWYPLLNSTSEKSKLVIADSGSTDKTHDIIVTMQKELPMLEVISDTERWHGSKLIALYTYAIENNIDYVFQTDSDGQTDPKEFIDFWNHRGEYDGIFGNRTVRGDGTIRAFVESVVCFLLKAYFKVSIPDANAPYRLMRCQTLKKYLYRLPKDYNIPNIMITTFFAYYHENIAFRNITFKPRQGGKNSINIIRIIKIGWKALSDFGRFKAEMRENQ